MAVPLVQPRLPVRHPRCPPTRSQLAGRCVFDIHSRGEKTNMPLGAEQLNSGTPAAPWRWPKIVPWGGELGTGDSSGKRGGPHFEPASACNSHVEALVGSDL